MMSQRVHKKKGVTQTPIVTDVAPSSSSVPIGIAPSDDDLHHLVSASPDDSELSHREAWMFRWGVFGCVCLTGASLLIVTYRMTLSRWESAPSPSQAAPHESVTISPTQTPLLFDRSTMRLHVVNATGVAGRARTALDALSVLGYRDDGVETATHTGQKTELILSADSKGYTAEILKDLTRAIGVTPIATTREGVTSHSLTLILGDE